MEKPQAARLINTALEDFMITVTIVFIIAIVCMALYFNK